jgi:hypothetical protein
MPVAVNGFLRGGPSTALSLIAPRSAGRGSRRGLIHFAMGGRAIEASAHMTASSSFVNAKDFSRESGQ